MYERGGDERGDEGACMVASPPLAIETNGWCGGGVDDGRGGAAMAAEVRRVPGRSAALALVARRGLRRRETEAAAAAAEEEAAAAEGVEGKEVSVAMVADVMGVAGARAESITQSRRYGAHAGTLRLPRVLRLTTPVTCTKFQPLWAGGRSGGVGTLVMGEAELEGDGH